MTQIDYYGILQVLSDLLLNDDRTKIIDGEPLTVAIESVLNPDTCNTPWVGLYLDDWSSPADQEFISGGQMMRTRVTAVLEMYEFSLYDETACKKRDVLFALIKQVLKDNRKLNGKVLITRFKGGNFDGVKSANGFFRGVTLKLESEIFE